MKMNWNKSIIKFTWNKLFVLVMVMIGKSLAAMPAYAMTPVEADIPFIVKGTPGTVRIEAENDAPLSEETEQTVEGNGKFIIQYTEPDNYVYHVYELPDGDNGVVYDTTDYQVMVSVMVDDDGNLIPRLSLSTKDNNEKPMEIKFENKISAPPETETSSETETPPTSKKPPVKTGDTTPLGIYLYLCLLSALVPILLLIKRRTGKT